MLWGFDELVALFGGENVGKQLKTGATHVAIDSRMVQPGSLFIALTGAQQDGHLYVQQALNNGAIGAVVSTVDPQLRDHLIIVPDTYQALVTLASAARQRCQGKIIGVTGSFGKTTTKEMLSTILSAQGTTVANIKSYNNHTGVPLSVAHLQANTQFGVFEMGMNHPEEITPLTKIARPHAALITAIGPAHIEHLGTIEAIAKAKAEIFAGLEPNGAAVLNMDTPQYETLVAEAKRQGVHQLYTFGRTAAAQAHLLDMTLTESHSLVEAMVCGTRLKYQLNIPGEHHVFNSLGALLAAQIVGADVGAAAASLAQLTPVLGRGQRHKVSWAGGEILVIDETYNAIPTAMMAAVQMLGNTSTMGRRIAVLGEMRELGPHARQYHQDLMEAIQAAKIDMVAACGEQIKEALQTLPPACRGPHRATSNELAPLVCELLQPGDVVMIKGSRGMRMENVLAEIIKGK